MSGGNAVRQVFLSHSSGDRKYAEAVLNALEKRGISCWYAPRDVPGGANYMGTISRAIAMTRVMVVVLSRNANRSEDMKREIALAGQKGLTVIGVRIDQTPLDDDWSFQFVTRQFLEASSNLDHVLRNELPDQIRGALTAAKRPQIPPGPTPVTPIVPPSPPVNRPSSVIPVPPHRVLPLAVAGGITLMALTLTLYFLSGTTPQPQPQVVAAAPEARPTPVIATKEGYQGFYGDLNKK